ncbi:MAG: Nif3-like dinuclear metal center hexameric protein [Saprospiraceae bacterium]|uniref:GTP cyclohydrolase 1 type 2 homolog n=1 Tax=Candidatus Opimibacter skivensis TaxID=2982028 RepID=A0A9D7XRD8_9BACT|nr:Nif3-like dinuclear metal center hexameric protein [Candidatus Opimibacter skivensis]
MTTPASELIQYLESVAPLHLQEKYDNSGLLVGSSSADVKGVLICLDCTEDVLDEAVQKGCNVVISHHPAIFYGLKQITGTSLTERLVIKAIKEDLILYAIHTNLDNILQNGVNERIAKQLDLNVEGILRPISTGTNEICGAGIIGAYSSPKTESEFLGLLKARMKTGVIRHSKLLGRPLQRVAVCGGSGSFLLEDAIREGAQVFVTADYKYHGFFDADDKLIICDIGHYESEQYTINVLHELISSKFATFAAHCTQLNTNPVHYFT